MRREWIEGVSIGVVIGVLVVALRTLVTDAPRAQIIGLALAGIVLCLVQVGLNLRRARRDTTTSNRSRSAFFRAAPRQNPFTREANQSWTGLIEHPPESTPLANSAAELPSRDEESS